MDWWRTLPARIAVAVLWRSQENLRIFWQNYFSYFVSACLIGVGLIYHAHGQNDWLSPETVDAGMSMAQMTNEIIASISFVGAFIIWALVPAIDRARIPRTEVRVDVR